MSIALLLKESIILFKGKNVILYNKIAKISTHTHTHIYIYIYNIFLKNLGEAIAPPSPKVATSLVTSTLIQPTCLAQLHLLLNNWPGQCYKLQKSIFIMKRMREVSDETSILPTIW